MQRVHFQVRVGVFNCQRFLSLSLRLWQKTNRTWLSVVLVKFHWFGINWHVFNQSEYRNYCWYIIIPKISPQAKSGKCYQIWFPPRFGGKNGGVLSMRMQVILDSSFARPGSAPIWGRKKGEFRDWTRSPHVIEMLNCILRSEVTGLIWPNLRSSVIFCFWWTGKEKKKNAWYIYCTSRLPPTSLLTCQHRCYLTSCY